MNFTLTFTAEQVANLLLNSEKHFKSLFFIKRKNEEAIFFSKKENDFLIICFNSHFSTTLNKDLFLNNFKNEKFYFYDNPQQIDEEPNDKYYRQ